MYTLLVTGDVPGASSYFNPLLQQSIVPCTSGTRPSSPPDGMTIYETDTQAHAYYNGTTTSWRYRNTDQGALVRKAATASITNNTFFDVQHDTELYDSDSMWTSGALMNLPVPGLWLITAKAGFASNATGLRALVLIFGTAPNVELRVPAVNGATTDMVLSHHVYVASTETVKMQVAQTSGGSLSTVANAELGASLQHRL